MAGVNEKDRPRESENKADVQSSLAFLCNAFSTSFSKSVTRMEEINSKLDARLEHIERRIDDMETSIRTCLTASDYHSAHNEIDAREVEFIESVGRGTFAEVYLCKWKGRDVAVKALKEDSVRSLGFHFEYQRMRNLQHKNLLQIYGLYGNLWPPHLVIEFVKEGNLRKYLSSNKKKMIRNTGKLLQLCFQVSEGMSYLESQGFVHRSLAARNIFYFANQPCKIADYGLTKVTPECKPHDPIRWLPPEFFNDKNYSLKTDVWSLGVVMWEIFKCGNMPFGTLSNKEVFEIVVNKRGILEKPQYCPLSVYVAMKRCWSYDEQSRPTSSSVRSHLEQILQELATEH